MKPVALSFQSRVWWMWSYFGMSVWKAFSDYAGIIEWRSETRQLSLSSFEKTQQDLKRASFLSGMIQQDWEWRGSQFWSRGAAYENGREQLGRRDSGLLQATVLLTHTFLTLEMHSQAFHCAQVSLVKVHWKYNGGNWSNASFLLVALLEWEFVIFKVGR